MLIHWLFYIFCITQVFFFILALSAFIKIRIQSISHFNPTHKELSTSVVICAHNEVPNLKKLLPLLYQQHYFQKEIIVVDDYSTDSTKEFLKQERVFHPELKVLNLKRTDCMSGKKKRCNKAYSLPDMKSFY